MYQKIWSVVKNYYVFWYTINNVLTLCDVGSIECHKYENQLLDQTKGCVFVPSLLHHLQKHLFATYRVLLCFPRIQSQSHHDFLPSVQRPLMSATVSKKGTKVIYLTDEKEISNYDTFKNTMIEALKVKNHT